VKPSGIVSQPLTAARPSDQIWRSRLGRIA
jgi:hypothetical protein